MTYIIVVLALSLLFCLGYKLVSSHESAHNELRVLEAQEQGEVLTKDQAVDMLIEACFLEESLREQAHHGPCIKSIEALGSAVQHRISCTAMVLKLS